MNDHNANHLLSGASHPTPSRRHRSSSSLSTRSANTAVSGLTGTSAGTIGTTGGIAGSTFSGIAPARDAAALYQSHARESLSRHDSMASSRRSEASSPSLSSSLQQGDHFSTLLSHRQSVSSSQQGQSQHPNNAVSARSSYLPSTASTSRFEETAHHRSELEMVKRENESLRRRIRELERYLSSRRHAESHQTRSDSPSTGGSIPPPASGITTGQRVSGEEEDEVVHVGESAGSVGLGGGLWSFIFVPKRGGQPFLCGSSHVISVMKNVSIQKSFRKTFKLCQSFADHNEVVSIQFSTLLPYPKRCYSQTRRVFMTWSSFTWSHH